MQLLLLGWAVIGGGVVVATAGAAAGVVVGCAVEKVRCVVVLLQSAFSSWLLFARCRRMLSEMIYDFTSAPIGAMHGSVTSLSF